PVGDREDSGHACATRGLVSPGSDKPCVSVGIAQSIMKVAITHPYSWPEVRRGAERIMVETGRALAARGHEVTVFTAGGAPGRDRHGGITTVRYRRVFVTPQRHERWFGWRVFPDLVRGRFDAVHSP